MICSHCGQPVPDGIGMTLDGAFLWIGGERIRLGPVQARIVSALLGKAKTMEQLIDEVYGDDPDGGPLVPDGSIMAMFCTVNDKIARHGVRIACVEGRYAWKGHYGLMALGSGEPRTAHRGVARRKGGGMNE